MVLANATLTRARLPGPNNDMKLIETWWSPLHQNLLVSLCAVVGWNSHVRSRADSQRRIWTGDNFFQSIGFEELGVS